MALPSTFHQDPRGSGISVGSQTAGGDNTPCMTIAYIGPPEDAEDPQVAIINTHDIAFYLDAANTTLDTASFTTADTYVTVAGIIDTDAAGANVTFGTIADAINAKDYWRCQLLGARRSDLIYTHSGTLGAILAKAIDATGSDARSTHGAVILWDTSEMNQGGVCMGPEALDYSYGTFMARKSKNTLQITDPDYAVNGRQSGETFCPRDRTAFIQSITMDCTTAACTTLNFYSVNDVTDVEMLVRSITGWESTATVDFDDDPIFSLPGERLVVAVVLGSATLPLLTINGGFGWWE